MLLSLVIIVALVWSAVIGTIFSNFLVFYSNFAETENYNKAYYTAIAALERAELVTKQRQPWYDWWWGRRDNNLIGWQSDWPINNGFSYLSRDSGIDSASVWRINSLTDRIPRGWEWDVEKTLSADDSMDFNMMNYNDSEVFLLYYDPGSNNPYTKLTKEETKKSHLERVSGKIRLPKYLYGTFDKLNSSSSLVWNEIKNDVIVDWQVMWKDKDTDSQFTIFATQRTSFWWHISREDTAIREEDINDDGLDFNFLSRNPTERGDDNWTIIGKSTEEIGDFHQIFIDDRFYQNQIKFSLLNPLKDFNWDIYPFLEYFVEFEWDKVPDKYFTIGAEWNYWDYQINLTVHKPTTKKSVLQSFTTIF